jgi:D-proline reductase (dithiol) PrdB
MPKLDQLPTVQRTRIQMRPVPINTDTPWTAPAKPVSESRLAVVTTAGLHLRTDRQFAKYDQTLRVIPSDVAEGDLLQSQSSIGFDRSLRMRDINVVLPIDRLRELVEHGEIGSLAANFYSLVGAQENSEATAEHIGGELVQRLKDDGTELVLITPACPVCTHTGAAVQRVLEAAGLSTVSLSLVRMYSEKVRPPRALFVPFPFGAPCGMPGDASQQTEVLRAALSLFAETSGPILRDFEGGDLEASELSPVQASAVQRGAEPEMDAATETSMMRRYYEQWLEREHKTAVGLTGIPVGRFRGIIRFFESFLTDDAADIPQRPGDIPRPEFMRYCADDLKAMYLEGRMVMKPGERPDEAARWLWGETALGKLLVDVRDRMESSADDAIRDAAFGIAR